MKMHLIPSHSFKGCGVIRHPTKAGWWLKHIKGNSWEWTQMLHDAAIFTNAELAKMMEQIPGSTWMPTKAWLEQPDGSVKGRLNAP